MAVSMNQFLTLAAAVSIGAAGCSDVQPCSSCPQLDGTYALKWTHASTGCGQLAATPATVQVGQIRSTLTAVLGATSLQGTLYDSYDFVLTGFEGTTHLMFRGYAVPGGTVDAGVTDGGLSTRTSITLNGTLTTSDSASDAGCDAKDDFIGTRIGQ
jgi:hypothetical protein